MDTVIISFHSYPRRLPISYCHAHFTDEETGSERLMSCPGLHSQEVVVDEDSRV